MKKNSITFLFLGLALFFSQQVLAVVKVTSPTVNPTLEKVNGVEFIDSDITIEDIVNLKPKEIEKKAGKKLKFKEKLALKLAKGKIKKAMKKGKSPEEIKAELAAGDFNFHIGGFILGFLLGVLGVLIAYLLIDRDAGISALIGVGAVLVLVLLLVVAIGSSV